MTLVETATKQITTPSAVRGFTREALDALIASRDEPAWMRDRRWEAWRVLQDTPYPTTSDEAWRRTDIKALPLSEFSAVSQPPVADPRQGSVAQVLKGVPADWKRALRSDENSGALLSIDGVLAGYAAIDDLKASRRSPLGGRRSPLGGRTSPPGGGVIFTDMDTALREHADLIDRYFLTQAVRLDDDYFAALHGAFWRGGTLLYVPRGVQVELPLRSFTWLRQNETSATHTLVVMESGSRAVLIDEYGSAGKADASSPLAGMCDQALNVSAVELILNDGAQLDYVGLQDWGRNVWSFTNERALVGRDATLHWIVGGLGSKLTKTFLDARLIGQGATALLSGVFFADGAQHLDLDTEQNHEAPHTKSDLLYKGALKDSARTVWQGMIRVAKNAQKTDGYQANRNLLLSDKARADSIPGLEIEADDVRCTHGSTVGRVDEEEMFYLMSRGIGRLDSEALLVKAFFTPVLDRIPLKSVRERLKKEIGRKMTGRGKGRGL